MFYKSQLGAKFSARLLCAALLISALQLLSLPSQESASAAVITGGSIRSDQNEGVRFSVQRTPLTTAFTIEGWWKWATGADLTGNQLLFGGSYTPGIYTTGTSTIKLTRWGGGYDSGNCSLPSAITQGSWYHLAVGRSDSGLVTVWFNGRALANCTGLNVSAFLTDTQFPSLFGGNGAGRKFDGYIANYRATNSDLYGASAGTLFTPEASMYPLIAGTVNLLNTPNDATTGFTDLVTTTSGFTSHVGGTLSSEFPPEVGTAQAAFSLNAASGTYGSTTTLSTTGGSGSGAVTYSVVSGNCSVSGNVLSNTSAGNCEVTARKVGDGTYYSITSATVTVIIAKKSEVFSYSISSNTGTYTYGSTYVVTMTFPSGAVAGNAGWNVFKASTAIGINGGGDQLCTGATVTSAGAYTCSFDPTGMWPNAQALVISGLYVRFNGSTNYNLFNQDSVGTKLSLTGCDYAFCPSNESVTVTATNKSITFGTDLQGAGFETPYGDTGGQLRYTISNGANGATKAWGISCTSTYTTGSAVGTYPITCTSTTRPSGAPSPVTDAWVTSNTNYTTLWNNNSANLLYSLNNPREYTSAANWWTRGSFYSSDTYKYLSFVQGTLTVTALTLAAPTSVSASAIDNSSNSIKISFTGSANATSHSAMVYLNDGTTLVKTVSNYDSGTAITGLNANTAYKVAIKGIGNGSNTNDSSNSSLATVTTNANFNRTVIYLAGAGATGTPPATQIKLTGETFTVESGSTLSKAGSTFLNWNSGASTYSEGSIFTVGGINESLTAQWSLNSYPVTFNANGGSGGSTININYNENAITSAPAVSRSQYTFAGWAETTTASAINTWTVVGTKTLYSLWTPKIYSVTYNSESGTAVTSSETFTVGTTPIQLQGATRNGYKFNGWYTDKSGGSLIGAAGADFTPTDTATVHAQWTQASLVGLSSPTSFGTIIATSGNDGGLSATTSGTKAEIDYFADSLPVNTVITAYLQGSTTYAASHLTGVPNLLLSVVVAWKAPDESVPVVDASKNAIRLKITNASIKRGAKVYSIVGDSTTILTTAAQDGYVIIELREDPEIVIANPVEIPTPPAQPSAAITIAAATDNSAAEKAAKLKADEDAKLAAELKAAQEKAARDLQAARDKADADIKAAAAAADLAAQLKAEADARLAAELKAKQDSEIAAQLASKKIVPNVTLYSISPTLKLSVYDLAYLKNYVATLKPKATVTCIGYSYEKNTSLAKAKAKATSQSTAICKLIKAQRKTITTKIVIYPSSKAPKAAAGAKWVAVSYRVDGFKS